MEAKDEAKMDVDPPPMRRASSMPELHSICETHCCSSDEEVESEDERTVTPTATDESYSVDHEESAETAVPEPRRKVSFPQLHLPPRRKDSKDSKSTNGGGRSSRSSGRRGKLIALWDAMDDEESMGSPAPRWHPEDGNMTPEMLEQRAQAMQRVARMSELYRQELDKIRQEKASRSARKHKTAPSRWAPSGGYPTPGPSTQLPVASVSESCLTKGVTLDTEEENDKPIILLDWDDTILPTWYITDVVCPKLKKPAAEAEVTEDTPFFEALMSHAQVVHEILSRASQVARVAIVTLARRPWVETSAKRYLPGIDIDSLLEELRIPVYYAREHVCGAHVRQGKIEEGCDLFVIAKRNAMKRCIRRLCRGRKPCSNVMSVGDSLTEHEALKEVLWANDDDVVCKTLKLMSDPSLEHLTNELQVLSAHLDRMVTHSEDFDISMADVNDLERFATTVLAN